MVDNKNILESVTFFCPAFNEEENLEVVIKSALSTLKDVSNCFEIIIIDNDSTDNTTQIAERLATEIPEVRVIHHEFNREYGGALKSGFKNAKNKFVVYIDSDNQYDFGDFKKMIPYLVAYDIVVGYRKKRHDSKYRLFQSNIFNFCIRLLFNIKLRDINCSFKVYKREVLDNIDIYSNSTFIDAEMLINAKNKGYSIFEIPVQHFPRKAGKATGAKPYVVFLTIKEILIYWFKFCIIENISRLSSKIMKKPK